MPFLLHHRSSKSAYCFNAHVISVAQGTLQSSTINMASITFIVRETSLINNFPIMQNLMPAHSWNILLSVYFMCIIFVWL